MTRDDLLLLALDLGQPRTPELLQGLELARLVPRGLRLTLVTDVARMRRDDPFPFEMVFKARRTSTAHDGDEWSVLARSSFIRVRPSAQSWKPTVKGLSARNGQRRGETGYDLLFEWSPIVLNALGRAGRFQSNPTEASTRLTASLAARVFELPARAILARELAPELPPFAGGYVTRALTVPPDDVVLAQLAQIRKDYP